MATLREQMQHVAKLQNRRAVLKYVVEHLDSTFLKPVDLALKMVLLNDENLPVPDQVFDDAISSMLKEIEEIDSEVAALLDSNVQ